MFHPGMLVLVWIACIVLTTISAKNKNRNALGWFFLGLYFGPIALVIISLLRKAEKKQAKNSAQPLNSLSAVKAELEGLKDEFNILNSRLSSLMVKISILEGKSPVVEPASIPVVEKIQESQPALVVESEEPTARKADMEINLGKFWLNKIGIIVFSVGVAFLLSYTVARVGALAKISLGYLAAAALFIAGLKFEKIEKFVNYGRVLLGGAWAIAYFTTYAMYHFEASRIIHSQILELFLLAIVALGIILYSLRYKSEALTAITLFIGYFTSVLGDVGYFTLSSAGLLALVALFLVYKMQWVRFIFLGIVLTYLTHFFWVIKQISFSFVPAGKMNVENVYFLFDAGFLAIYWALFTAAIHLIKNNAEAVLQKKLAAANFINFLLFFMMFYPKFYIFYPEQKFNVVLGFGLAYLALGFIMDWLKKEDIFISDIIIGVSLLTLAIPLKFMPYHVLVIWFIELPFLLFTGFTFKRAIYRYLGFALSAFLFLRFSSSQWQLPQTLQIFSFTMSWQGFLAFMGFVSTAVCFSLYRFLKVNNVISVGERILQNFYSGFAVVYFTIYAWAVLKPPWLTLGLSLESLLVFVVGALLLDRYIRWYALVVLALAAIRFCFYGRVNDPSELRQMFFVYGPVAVAFAEYFIYRKINKKSAVLQIEGWLARILFAAAAALFIFAVVIYVQQIWITISIFVIALLALIWGVKAADKYIRVYSLLILGFAGIRFAFVDNYDSAGKLAQWLFILADLVCAYAAYFIYRAQSKKLRLDDFEKLLSVPLFYVSSGLAVITIFHYIKNTWISLSMGLVGVALFVVGFLIKDKIFRHGGFIIFGITLARVIFVDLAGLAIIYKIISFIILGILFLGVSFIYTKYASDKLNQKG
ncbi:MAG: DUF2339 domain-containing protein [Candidatus Omnitrophota bacterium]